MTPTEFRTLLPAFSDVTAYPNDFLQVWLDISAQLVNAERWGELTNLGIALRTAHEISIEKRAADVTAAGGVPGAVQGAMSSKSAGGVSVSYDVSSTTEKDAGYWNATSYGQRYYRMSRMMGAGPVQVGTGADVLPTSQAWAGPIYPP